MKGVMVLMVLRLILVLLSINVLCVCCRALLNMWEMSRLRYPLVMSIVWRFLSCESRSWSLVMIRLYRRAWLYTVPSLHEGGWWEL